MPTARRFRAPVVLPMDPACSVTRDGVVDVDEDGRVGYCGPAATAPPVPPETPRTALTGILMPGLINAHAHTVMTPLRGMGSDLPLMSWLQDVIWPAEARLRPRDAYAGMLLGCVEMLRYGVTTSSEMYFFGEQIVQAVLDAGGRVLLGMGYLDLPGQDWRGNLSAVSRWIDADGRTFGPADRIELCYAPHAGYTLPFEALVATAEAASARDALVHIHVAETEGEDRKERETYGSVPRMLHQAGLLDGRLLVAHAVHVSPEDIRLLARHGAGVAHCPGSNAKLASGMADLPALREAGIAVGLGTDGPASNDDLDVWEEMRLAAMFARLSARDSVAFGSADMLLMATREGARALGRTDIGALEAGAWADLVHVGVDGPQFATGLDVPDDQLLANLVWAAGSRAVRDVWVAGRQVVADGEPVLVDRAAAQHAVRETGAHLRH